MLDLIYGVNQFPNLGDIPEPSNGTLITWFRVYEACSKILSTEQYTHLSWLQEVQAPALLSWHEKQEVSHFWQSPPPIGLYSLSGHVLFSTHLCSAVSLKPSWHVRQLLSRSSLHVAQCSSQLEQEYQEKIYNKSRGVLRAPYHPTYRVIQFFRVLKNCRICMLYPKVRLLFIITVWFVCYSRSFDGKS